MPGNAKSSLLIFFVLHVYTHVTAQEREGKDTSKTRQSKKISFAKQQHSVLYSTVKKHAFYCPVKKGDLCKNAIPNDRLNWSSPALLDLRLLIKFYY